MRLYKEEIDWRHYTHSCDMETMVVLGFGENLNSEYITLDFLFREVPTEWGFCVKQEILFAYGKHRKM